MNKLTLIISVIGLIISLVALIRNRKANEIADRANKLSEEANLITRRALENKIESDKNHFRNHILEKASHAWEFEGTPVKHLYAAWQYYEKEGWILNDFEKIYQELHYRKRGKAPDRTLQSLFDQANYSVNSAIVRSRSI